MSSSEILVCLEGSPSSARAVDLAVRLARELPATLVGLAIVDEPDIRAGAATSIGGSSYKLQRDETLMVDAHARAQQWLTLFAGRCLTDGITARVLELSGAPAATILQEMKRHDFTVLGRDANFRFETAEEDEQTRDRILQRAGKPVLLVPADPVAAGRAVVVAFDGSNAAIRALHSFAASGLGREAELHVVAVHDDGAVAWQIGEAGRKLLAEAGLTATAHNIVSMLSVSDALLVERDKLDAGLIVLGGYTRSRFSRLLWGSVTQEVVRKSPVPLWLHY